MSAAFFICLGKLSSVRMVQNILPGAICLNRVYESLVAVESFVGLFTWKSKKFNFNKTMSYVVLSLALFAMTFFGVCSPDQGHIASGGNAASVGSLDISDMEFRRAYSRMFQQERDRAGEGFDPVKANLSQTVMNQLLSSYVAFYNAKNMGIGVDEKKLVEYTFNNFKDAQGKFDPQRYKNILASNGYTERQYQDAVTRDLVNEKYARLTSETFMVSKKAAELERTIRNIKRKFQYVSIDPDKISVTVTDADVQNFIAKEGSEAQIKEYFARNIREYDKPKQVKARHLLVAYKGSRRAAGSIVRTKEQAKSKAMDLLKRAKVEDFVSLAKANTDEESGKKTGGDLGWFSRKTMVKEFSDTAFKMASGDVSEVVETPFGFHIIKVEGIKEASKKTIEQVKPEIAKNLLQKNIKPTRAAEISKKLQDALVAGTDVSSLLSANGLKWQDTGDVSLSSASIQGIGSNETTKEKLFAKMDANKVFGEVFTNGNKKIIVKFLSESTTPSTEIGQDIDQISGMMRYIQAFRMRDALQKQSLQALDNKGVIHRNSHHMNYAKIIAASQQP